MHSSYQYVQIIVKHVSLVSRFVNAFEQWLVRIAFQSQNQYSSKTMNLGTQQYRGFRGEFIIFIFPY